MPKTFISPYHEALTWIEQGPGTGSAGGMAKLILSLWNGENAFSVAECIGNLDGLRTKVALDMITRYAQYGEDEALRTVGHVVCARFPYLWELGQAAAHAKHDLRRKWRDEQEARNAAEEAGEEYGG